MTPRQFRVEWARRGALMTDPDRANVNAVWLRLGLMFGFGLLGATIGTFVNTAAGLVILLGAIIAGGLSLCRIGVDVLRGAR